jgi:TfoX/Sxy family transcriptional regulator of competence genes
MGYDKELAEKIRTLLENQSGIDEKKMFGGICFLLHGNMACGVLNNDLIVRVGPERYGELLRFPHAKPFDITGRAMNGWIMVSAEGHKNKQELTYWVNQGLAFTSKLPAK